VACGQDAGGEDTPIPDALLELCDYLCPNESELARLTGLPVDSDAQVAAAAAALHARGARGVLATLGPRGALLALPDGTLLRQAALQPAGAQLVDATAAGDAFRAAFAVALVEGRPLQDCLRFASAAGGMAVTRMGAVPSLPHRTETDQLAASGGGEDSPSGSGVGGEDSASESGGDSCADPAGPAAAAAAAAAAAGATQGSGPACGLAARSSAAGRVPAMPLECPHRFASRLNSMRARRDLAAPSDGPDSLLGWIQRQARVPGLSLVAFNHPQHTAGHTPEQLRGALAAAGLGAAAVALRFPESEYGSGAFTHPHAAVRRRALELAVGGCRWAAALGAPDLVVWPQHDGYNYAFELDYGAAWERAVQAYRALADACPPGVRVSLEWKATDEAARWSLVPSTGAALLLVRQVGRPNFGLTLDAGHMLLAGENPAQSVALAGDSLFGLHLNDAAVRLGAEDGLALASVGGAAALELVRWLHRVNYTGGGAGDAGGGGGGGLRCWARSCHAAGRRVLA
jgi:sugar phosphate isomerase/epimerase